MEDDCRSLRKVCKTAEIMSPSRLKSRLLHRTPARLLILYPQCLFHLVAHVPLPLYSIIGTILPKHSDLPHRSSPHPPLVCSPHISLSLPPSPPLYFSVFTFPSSYLILFLFSFFPFSCKFLALSLTLQGFQHHH